MKAFPTLRLLTCARIAALAVALSVAGPSSFALHSTDDPSPTPPTPESADATPDSNDSTIEKQPQSSEAPQAPAVEETPAPPAPPAASASPAATAPDVVRKYAEMGDAPTIRSDSHLAADEAADNFVTIAGNATVDGLVRGNCVTIAGNAVVNGMVHGNCVTIGGSVTFNGTVNGNLVCIGGLAKVGPDAVVHGNVVAIGGGITVAPGARVHGNRVPITIPGLNLGSGWLGDWIQDAVTWARVFPISHGWAWSVAMVWILFNLALATMFRGATARCSRAIADRPFLSFVNGLLVTLLFIPFIVILCAIVVGIPLVPFAVIGKFLCGLIGTVGLYQFCGTQFGLGDRPVLAVFVGNVLFALLYAVPIVGLATWFVAPVIGLGAAVTALGSARRESKAARAAARALTNPTPVTPPVPPVAPTPPATAPAPTPPAAVAFVAPVETSPVTPPLPGFSSAPSAPASATPPALTSTPPPMAPPVAIPPLPADNILERAAFWPRLGAMALDFVFVAVVVAVASSYLNIGGMLLLFVWLGYHVAFWTWRGTTPGGIILNLRVERLDHRPIDFQTAFVRTIAGAFSFLALGLGFVWASIDEERQSWHDKIAGTTVVRLRKSQPLV